MGESRTQWRALVVDDEPPARELVTSYVRSHGDFEVVGECADGDAAARAIETLRPDVVFLDIRMPGRTGFDIVDEVGIDAMPLIVFVTAYDEHALEAFRIHAFDYLLKPVDPDLFSQTASRVSARLASDAAADRSSSVSAERLDRLLAALEREHEGEERLTVWEGGRAVFVRTAEIERAEVDGNYVRLHVGAARHLMRETMSGLEERLPSSRFVRLNRSVIVNIDAIKEVQPYFHGDFAVLLRDGTTVLTGRTYRARLRRRFRADR